MYNHTQVADFQDLKIVLFILADDKKYGVSLAYHFSREIDVFAQTTVKESIQKIRHTLEKMGYLVYDEKKNFNAKGIQS